MPSPGESWDGSGKDFLNVTLSTTEKKVEILDDRYRNIITSATLFTKDLTIRFTLNINICKNLFDGSQYL